MNLVEVYGADSKCFPEPRLALSELPPSLADGKKHERGGRFENWVTVVPILQYVISLHTSKEDALKEIAGESFELGALIQMVFTVNVSAGIFEM